MESAKLTTSELRRLIKELKVSIEAQERKIQRTLPAKKRFPNELMEILYEGRLINQ